MTIAANSNEGPAISFFSVVFLTALAISLAGQFYEISLGFVGFIANLVTMVGFTGLILLIIIHILKMLD